MSDIANKPTFLDLYKYIQVCERDEVGMHVLHTGGIIDGKPIWALQVYDNKDQVNVCMLDSHGLYTSVLNFVFEEHDSEGTPWKVWIVPVKFGRADYDSDNRLTALARIDTEVDESEPVDWSKISTHGRAVRMILVDLLTGKI